MSEMERLIAKAIVTLLRGSSHEWADYQPIAQSAPRIQSYEWDLAEKIEKELSLVEVKPEKCPGHSYRSAGCEGEWVCVFCGGMYLGLPPTEVET